jgi:toxin ParE1/3/4
MKTRRVTIDPDARADLRALHDWIRLSAAPRTATAYIRRIRDFAASLDIAAERGTALDDIDPGLRSIPFESVVLAVRVGESTVTVVRILHASQDWAKLLRREAQARLR